MIFCPRRSALWVLAITYALFLSLPATAQEPIRMAEQFVPGAQYHVSSRVELSGSLTPQPVEKAGAAESPPKPLTITGQSAIEYDERVLPSPDTQAQKTVRIYRRIELQRKLGDQPQQTNLRPTVRRLVLIRSKTAKVAFSPDGPLTWGEIDLVRTDLFTAVLAGLLPDKPVRPGDRWNAAPPAVQELTDVERIDEGGLECRFDELTTLAGRRHARISLTGSVRGINEDGPTRQQIDGYFFFDLESNHLSYLSFKGIHTLLDAQGKESGRVEGRFVLTRQANQRSADLSDQALRGVVVDPNADNTLLLYDNPDLGVRLLYPRRWRIGGVRGRQLILDEANGNGLLLTLEPLSRLPSAAQFLAESRDYLQKQKAKLLRVYPPQRLQGPPQELDRFALDIEMAGQGATMEYFVARQAQGGATLAARLLPATLAEMQKEVDRIARSVTITAPQK
jgi:hypothetical protein